MADVAQRARVSGRRRHPIHKRNLMAAMVGYRARCVIGCRIPSRSVRQVRNAVGISPWEASGGRQLMLHSPRPSRQRMKLSAGGRAKAVQSGRQATSSRFWSKCGAASPVDAASVPITEP
jgi:hypothetical protein